MSASLVLALPAVPAIPPDRETGTSVSKVASFRAVGFVTSPSSSSGLRRCGGGIPGWRTHSALPPPETLPYPKFLNNEHELAKDWHFDVFCKFCRLDCVYGEASCKRRTTSLRRRGKSTLLLLVQSLSLSASRKPSFWIPRTTGACLCELRIQEMKKHECFPQFPIPRACTYLFPYQFKQVRQGHRLDASSPACHWSTPSWLNRFGK